MSKGKKTTKIVGKAMIPWGAAIARDVMTKFHIPGGATLGKFADEYLKKKQRQATDIFIEEVAHGLEGIEFEETDAEPLIEIVYRFSKAAADGAARDNLRLLAQVIVGLKKNKALDPDKFRKWANILEQLTRDELMVIGKAIAIRRKIVAAGANAPNSFWEQLNSELAASRYPPNEIDPLCASVSRTGLLVPVGGLSSTVYMPSPWLEELGTLADIEGLPTGK